MKDPIGTCSYNQLYQNLKQFSKNGDYFFKELITVFQQRAELELTYSKGLQKLAGKLIRACQGMSRNSTYRAWCHVSDEMYSRADAHRSLGTTFNQEAIVEIRQVLDEHSRRKRPLDSAIERNGKLFTANWNEQLKLKKKLSGLTREHEALFNYVENNKHISSEKEKQKMLHRLTKSAEQQARVDEEYFNINMEGHQMRLKWENTLKSCYQITQELEKQRLEVLCNLLSRYKLHMSSFGQTLKHGQKQIEQAVQRVDMEKDVQTLIDENKAAVDDNKVEFLMTDYLEEDSKSLMSKDRRQQSIRVKLQRLEDNVAKTKKDCEGIEKLMKTYAENPSFSNQKNLEETEELHDECTLKLDLLEATHYKLYSAISECERQSYQRLSRNIFKWKDKKVPICDVTNGKISIEPHLTVYAREAVALLQAPPRFRSFSAYSSLSRRRDCEHSVVQVTRPVKLRRTPFRSRQSLRASIIYKGPVQILTQPAMEPTPAAADLITPSAASEEKVEIGSSDTGAQSHTDQTAAEPCCVGKCKALYNFTAEHNGELALKEGDLVDVYTKGETGWWFGVLNGQKGHFPSTYVEDLPVLSCIKSSDA